MTKLKYFTAVLFVAICLPAGALAEATSAASSTVRLQEAVSGQQRERKIESLRREYDENKASSPKSTKEQAKPADKSDLKILVNRIRVKYSKVLTKDFWDRLKLNYPKKDYTLAAVKELVAQINAEYEKQGFLTSRAYLAPQQIKNKTITVSLFEGKTGKINVVNNGYVAEDYVKKSLDIPARQVLNLKNVENSILMYNAANESKVRVSLRPSKKVGFTDIDVAVHEPQRFEASVFADNAGTKENGYYRGGVVGVARKLLPFDMIQDKVTLGGLKSEGSSSFFASYDITEPYLNTTWSLGVDWSDTEIVSGPMESLEVKGDFYDWHLGVKRPVFVTENSVVTGGLRSDIKHSKNHLAELKVHDIKTDTVSGFVDWLYLFDRGYFYNMFEATHAVHINQGQGHFWHYNYLAEGQVGFLNTWAVNVKTNAQYTNDEFLPSSDQIQLGGFWSVRGYAEGLLVGDKGFSVMSEIKKEIQIPSQKWINRAETFVFYDCGRLWSNEVGSVKKRNETFLSSTGLGVRTSIFERFNASLTAGFPIRRQVGDERQNKVKILFNVQMKLY